MGDQLTQPYEGQLIKFTNVVKGWQARWFVLHPESGLFQYYLCESDKHERARGSLQLAGAVISPSDEDAHTFIVSAAVGESYKLRAHDTRDRQMWLNRLRVVAEMHTRAIAHSYPPLAPREHRGRDGLVSAGGYGSLTGQQAWTTQVGGGLAVLDAFTQVAELLEDTKRLHSTLVEVMELLPSHGNGLKCTEPNILLMKATSHSTILCLDQCLGILRTQHSALPQNTSAPVRPRLGSPSLRSSSPSLRSRTAPQSPAPTAGAETIPVTIPNSNRSRQSTPETFRSSSAPSDGGGGSSPARISPPDKMAWHCSDSEISDIDQNAADNETDRNEVEEGQRSVILHIISQLRLGMDLTRVTLPTFILEKRSLLEMFADFLGHPDYFLKISYGKTPEERMLAVVKWYMTSIHVGRDGSTPRKPYNPIIGETFHCSWRVKDDDLDHVNNCNNKINKSSYYTIRYSSEQVSHHPPVSAFYFECPEKKLCINAHIWTKSKFMGMSVGVNLLGDISLTVGEYNECYSLSMPSAYARSVLTEPWVELGGRVNISCSQSGYTAPIVFHTKPFYGGKLHRVTAEVKNETNTVLYKVQGEWDSILEFQSPSGDVDFLDVRDIPITSHKRVKPIPKQLPSESRRLWQDVSVALLRGDLERATSHKRALEDKQRAEEQERATRNASFPTKLFSPTNGDHWVYKNLPEYAMVTCTNPSLIIQE